MAPLTKSRQALLSIHTLIALVIGTAILATPAFADCSSRYETAISQVRHRTVELLLTVGKIESIKIEKEGREEKTFELKEIFEGTRDIIANDFALTHRLIQAARNRSLEFKKLFEEVKRLRPHLTAVEFRQEILYASEKDLICDGVFATHDFFKKQLRNGTYQTQVQSESQPLLVDPFSSPGPDGRYGGVDPSAIESIE